MLQNEITPFAKAHQEALDGVITTLYENESTKGIVSLTTAQMEDIILKLKSAKNGFERFRVCAEDEWQMKEKYRKAATHCRVYHSDK